MVLGPLVAAHDHLPPASAAVAGVAPPQVLPREPDEEEAGDRSPHSKPTRDHPPATPGACHWLAHRSNRIRTQLPQVAIARRRAVTFRSAFSLVAYATKRLGSDCISECQSTTLRQCMPDTGLLSKVPQRRDPLSAHLHLPQVRAPRPPMT